MQMHSKGSHIRKSLQTMGMFINGSERRTAPHPVETTPFSKLEKYNGAIVIKSPVTSDARSRMRQSLASMTTSRRSSIGGQSRDASSGDVQNSMTRTPPPVYPSREAKAGKQWH